MKNPTIYDLFKNSHFGATKTCRNLSSITIDHLYEQSNKAAKEDGGTMNCTDCTDSTRS